MVRRKKFEIPEDYLLILGKAYFSDQLSLRNLRYRVAFRELNENRQVKLENKEVLRKSGIASKHFLSFLAMERDLGDKALSVIGKTLLVDPQWLRGGECGVLNAWTCPDWLLPTVQLFSRTASYMAAIQIGQGLITNQCDPSVWGLAPQLSSPLSMTPGPSHLTLQNPVENWMEISALVPFIDKAEAAAFKTIYPQLREDIFMSTIPLSHIFTRRSKEVQDAWRRAKNAAPQPVGVHWSVGGDFHTPDFSRLFRERFYVASKG